MLGLLSEIPNVQRITPTNVGWGVSGTHAYLDDIQAGGPGTTHIDGDGLHQGALGKILDLLGHGGTEQQGLPLALRKKSDEGIWDWGGLRGQMTDGARARVRAQRQGGAGQAGTCTLK